LKADDFRTLGVADRIILPVRKLSPVGMEGFERASRLLDR
jgi:hypothetical protein